MPCPNSDPGFNKLLSYFVEVTPDNRRMIFYMVCIWVRFALYSAVYITRESVWIPYIVGGFSLIAAINLATRLEGRQWWSKKFQLVIAILLIIVSIGRIWNPEAVGSLIIPGLLYISLIGGIIQSLFIKFC